MHIIGAGGHAKVVLEILMESQQQIEGVWDEDPEITSLMGYPIDGNFQEFKEQIESDLIILAIGNNGIRKKLAEQLGNNRAKALHPTCAMSESATVGIGTVAMANVSVNAEACIGKYVILNTNASVDHDCKIGDFVHVSPQVGLAGNVEVGEGTQIGIGACVIQGIKIGKWAIIGAGAVIIRDVPDYAVVVGNPGKIIKYNKI